MISTLFVRQHWIVDQLLAALITIPVAYFFFDRFKYTRVEEPKTRPQNWQVIAALIVAIVAMVMYIYSFTLV